MTDVARLAAWPTPTESMATEQDLAQAMTAGNGKGRKAYADSGIFATSSPAGTGKRGVLRPGHARWLMGYPAAWDSCGATGIASVRNLRRSS